jgi:uncharacterized protein YndB with AHSA1/START domain
MENKLVVKTHISIKAPAAKIWDQLTNPKQTKQYMFGCEALSDWRPGSPLVWKMKNDGKEIIAVKGNVVRIQHGKYLEYTTFDPNSGLTDAPENYLTVTCRLLPGDGHTTLSVSQGDFSLVEDSMKRYDDSLKGWQTVLPKIKELAERS